MRYHYRVQVDFGEDSLPQHVRFGVVAGSLRRATAFGEQLARREYRRRRMNRTRRAARLPRVTEVTERGSVDAHD